MLFAYRWIEFTAFFQEIVQLLKNLNMISTLFRKRNAVKRVKWLELFSICF